MRERSLEEVAGLVSDGAAVSWDEAEASLNGAEDLELVRQLRVVAGISNARGHGRSPIATSWRTFGLRECIGEGGSARVYRAWDAELERDVALKVVSIESGREEALQEARLLARIKHPNVVRVYGAALEEDELGIWMELIEGQTLEGLIRDLGPLSGEEAVAVGRKLCSALAAVHESGITHGDIKARNVMRERGGRIVLMDMGMARSRDQQQEATTSGTPLYVAPETLLRGQSTAASDIYSLGVLLYNLVSEAYPVEGTSVGDVRTAHRQHRRVLLRDRRSDLSSAFVRAVELALEQDPTRRPQSVGEMEARLESGPSPVVREATGPAGGRWTWKWGAASVGALALLLAGLTGIFSADEYSLSASLMRSTAMGNAALASGDRVRLGDKLFLEFEASRSLWVYIFNRDEVGDAFLLFPLPSYDLQNPLAPDQLHRLPGSRFGAAASWQVTSTGGRDYFLVVASPNKLPELESQLATLVPAGNAPALALPETVLRGLRGIGGTTTASGSADRAADIFAQAQRLASAAAGETVSGVWVRQIVLENPAP